MEEPNYEYVEALEKQNKELQNKNLDVQSHISNSSFNQESEMNQRQWQLETDDILDRIEHFLKGEIIETDADGNTHYRPQIDESLVILNKYGVNSVMSILGNYINRNHILSIYELERIYEILADLGDELADFILCNYEKMGMDTEFKKSRYKLLVLNILHSVESSYRRALKGRTAEGMNVDVRVLQTDNIGMGNRMMEAPKKKLGWF